MKMLGVAAFALVVAVMLAYYGGDRRQKKQQQRVEQAERERDGMQNYSQRRAAERTEALERAQTEGPYGRQAPPVEPANKTFTKEQFDRDQERRDDEMRRRVERERYEYERERQRREYEARREEEAARRAALIKED